MTRQANIHPTKGQSMRVKLSIFCVLAGLSLGIAASPALAVRGHVFSNTFATPGSAAGQLNEPEALAVDEASHDVYVADRGNDRVDVFTAAGGFVEAWGWGVKDAKEEFELCTSGSGCLAGLPGSGEGQFFHPNRIAVDNACVLNGLTEATTPKCSEFDPSNGDVYVETGEFGHQVVDKFTAAGVFLGVITGPPAPEPGAFARGVEGVAVDSDGGLRILATPAHLLSEPSGVDDYSNAVVNVFEGFVPLSQPSAGFLEQGLAVDGEGDLFPRFAGDVPEDSATGVLLSGQVEGLAPGFTVAFNGVAVELSTGDVYLSDLGEVRRFGPLAAGVNPSLESFGAEHLQSEPCDPKNEFTCRGGLAVDSSSGAVFVSVGSEGRVVRFVLEPPAVPVVQGSSVSEVKSGSVRFAGEVNPRSEPFEAATSYWFEYTPVAQFAREGWTGAEKTPTAQLAPSYVLGAVSAPVTGLAPGTAYRYRLVAENVLGVTDGEVNGHSEEVPRVLTTQPLGESGLLDDRSYELVSPPDKLGALLEPLANFEQFALQAAAGGGGVTYVASAPTEATPTGNAGYTQVLSSRSATGGWATRDLVVAHATATAVTEHPEWPLFSGDLARAAVQPLGGFDGALSPLASEQTAYVRDDFQGGGASGELCSEACYTPLVTAANTPSGTVFGLQEEGPKSWSEQCPPDPFCGPQIVAASPDLKHVVMHSRAPLAEGGPVGAANGGGGLYEASEGALTFVGEGEVGAGRTGEVSMVSAGTHSVSVDGSRVIFKGSAAGKSGLLLRDTVTGEVVRLAGGAVFLGASQDDSKIYFENESGGPLEMCEIVAGESGELQCNRSGEPLDLTPGASVLAPLAGVSEDGASVYFVSTTVLSGAEKDPGGEQAVNGQPNLYDYREGVTRLVAVLSNGDTLGGGNGRVFSSAPRRVLAESTERVSPDGGWLAFVSERDLTGYDNTQAQHGQCEVHEVRGVIINETGECREVFLYHAPTAGQPGSVVCASCDPTGSRPSGGASVPGWTNGLYQSRYLSDGGRLFFDSPDQLVPQDTNGAGDVYEYEPPAGPEAPVKDTCTSASPAFSPVSGGCVDLISSGSSPQPSSFLDASETGQDVFFLTSAQISKRDTDTSPDVYDAHVEGAEPEPETPVECQGDACQPFAAPPAIPTLGTSIAGGLGNFPAPLVSTAKKVTKKTVKCKKPKKLTHGKCEKPKKHKAKKSAHTNRRVK